MKFIFAILSLICFILAQKSLAGPINIEPSSAQLSDPRLGIPNFTCVIHCVQPVGEESEGDDIRGIIGNYLTLFDCIKECSK
jgi:hypothetical protein